MTVKDIAAYFDGIYYINLAHRRDRDEQFKANAENLHHPNIIRFEAIYGHDLDLAGWPGKPGALGVRQSHIALLKDALCRNFKRFIVFEDDAVIGHDFGEKLVKLLTNVSDDWDMIYLYAEYHYLQPIPVNKYVIKLQNTLGLVAVVYNSRHLERIIDKLENDFRWVDSCMADLHLSLNVYASRKSIVTHLPGFSDNEGLAVNYQVGRISKLTYRLKRQVRGLIKRVWQ